MRTHFLCAAVLIVSTLSGCQTAQMGASSPSLSEVALSAFSSNTWPSSYLANRNCRAPVDGYYSTIGAARTMTERDNAFEALGFSLVPHPRKAGQKVISDTMPQRVRVDFHATNSVFSGDMDPHDIAAMACFVE